MRCGLSDTHTTHYQPFPTRVINRRPHSLLLFLMCTQKIYGFSELYVRLFDCAARCFAPRWHTRKAVHADRRFGDDWNWKIKFYFVFILSWPCSMWSDLTRALSLGCWVGSHLMNEVKMIHKVSCAWMNNAFGRLNIQQESNLFLVKSNIPLIVNE